MKRNMEDGVRRMEGVGGRGGWMEDGGKVGRKEALEKMEGGGRSRKRRGMKEDWQGRFVW